PIEIDCLHEGIDFSTKISRAKFEELNATYFDKCIQLLESCLFDGEMKKKDVDEVVVVGGAAILAARLSGNDDDHDMKPNVVLLDVIPRSLGIEIEIDGEKGHMEVIIPKNTCMPTSMKAQFATPSFYATSVDISVYQGEGVKVMDNVLLGRFSFKGLTPGTDGQSDIEVCFNLDINGILLVSAEELSTGQRKSITITKT
ncbi:heat shock cognate 70 kDa protein-like protein, partial [Tanacetum coccineum]